jgi:hypothetical protein
MAYIAGDTVWKFTVSDPLYDAPEGSNVQLGIPNTNYAPESENFLPRTNGAGANAPSENLGFYFGGMWNANGDKFTSSIPPANRSTDLIKVNTFNQGHADWQIYPLNESITPWRAEAGLVWLPVSTQGVLLAIGGVTAPADLGIIGNQEDATTSQSFLKQFPIYDIGSNTWALQDLDSASPFPDEQLAQFCTVVASSKDGSHHEIFVYGGSNGNMTKPKSDVWVLSVPSFTWIKADGSERAGVPRLRHVCTAPYPDQMIVIGGTGTGGKMLEPNQAIDVYNLNDLNWTGAYDPDTHHEYEPHQTILDVISKKPTADNISSQVAGWFDQKYNTDKIKFYGPFRGEVTEPPPVSNNTVPNNTTDSGNSTTPNPPAEPHSDRSWVTPVAAAVPSGTVVIIIGIIFLLWRRKRRFERGDRDTETTEVNQRKSWVVPWLWATHQQQKEVGSDTVTEVEPAPKSPPMSPAPQELEGNQRDGYFTPSDMNESNGQRWSSTTPARSPLGGYTGPVEGPDNPVNPVHEVEGGYQPVVSDQINYDIKNLPFYPPTIVSGGNYGVARSASLGSPDEYHLPGPLETNPPIAPSSPRGIPVYPGGDYAQQDGFGPLDRAVSPITNRQNQRPNHHRHNSSVSSGMSFPSPDLEQSPRSVPSASRSLSGEHNYIVPANDAQENDRGNHTY